MKLKNTFKGGKVNKADVMNFIREQSLIKKNCLGILNHYLLERYGHTSTGVAHAGYVFDSVYYNKEKDDGTFSYNHWHDGPGPQGNISFPLDLLWDSDWKDRISKVAKSEKEGAKRDRANSEEFGAKLKTLCSKYGKTASSHYDFQSVPLYVGGPNPGTVYTTVEA